MISLPSNIILVSVFFSLVFGSICGFIYTLIRFVFSILYRLAKNISKCRIELKSQRNLIINIFDFLFFFSVGIVHLIFAYVLVDGVFEIYSLIMLFVGFVVSKGIFNSFFCFKGKMKL